MTAHADPERAGNGARQAYQVLRLAFIIVPIVAGIDQFTDKLANWDMYLAPLATRTVPLPAHTLMMIAGVAEIIAGLIVAFTPRIDCSGLALVDHHQFTGSGWSLR